MASEGAGGSHGFLHQVQLAGELGHDLRSPREVSGLADTLQVLAGGGHPGNPQVGGAALQPVRGLDEFLGGARRKRTTDRTETDGRGGQPAGLGRNQQPTWPC